MKKRLFALAMALCMVFTMLPSVALAEGEAMPTTKWADHADTSWYTDAPAGTTEFVIDTAEELAGFAKLVDSGNKFLIPAVAAVKDADGNVITPAQPAVMKIVKLGADIDLAAHLWEPIGGTGNPSVFQGEFDGCGYTVRNLKLQNISSKAGLFGTVGGGNAGGNRGAYIHDLTIDGATMLNCGGGVLMGSAFHSNVITDVTVKNVTITGTASAITGGVQGSQFKNVKAENVTITHNGNGQIAGMFGGSIETNGTVRTAAANPHFLDYTILANGNALVNYFENCDGENITINYNNPSSSYSDCYVGGFFSYQLSYPTATTTMICVNCDLVNLQINATGGAIVGGFGGIRGGNINNSELEVMIDGKPMKLTGFNGCSVEGKITTETGYAGGFAGTSGDYSNMPPNFAEAEYYGLTVDVDINVREGGTSTVGGFAGEVNTGKNATIPQTLNGCKVLGTIDAPQTATVGGLIGVAKTPASGGDISVENCQVKALEELEQYMEQHPELSEEDAALQLMFGNINGMASDELKAETQPDNITIGNATTAPYYEVAFVHNGHGEAAATQSVLFGKTAEEPTAPEEEGWVFEGWFTDEELTTPYDFTTPITKDITLYAKWTEVIVEPEPDEEEPEEPRPSLPTIVRGDKAEQVTDAAGNALGAYLDMTAEELAEAVFTSADPRPNRKVRLVVVDAANSLNAAQRNALEEAALGDVIVSYLDITLFKQAGSGREQQVTRTNAPIRITLQVPAWAINHDPAVSRMYYMLHWHDGEVERIYGDFDPAAGTFTFETDCFSPYALCYTDVTTLGVPKTGTGVGLFAGGALLLAAGLCLLRARKKKA